MKKFHVCKYQELDTDEKRKKAQDDIKYMFVESSASDKEVMQAIEDEDVYYIFETGEIVRNDIP